MQINNPYESYGLIIRIDNPYIPYELLIFMQYTTFQSLKCSRHTHHKLEGKKNGSNETHSDDDNSGEKWRQKSKAPMAGC